MQERSSTPQSSIQLAWGQEKLTPEQETAVRQLAQEYVATLFSTQPVDEQKAEEHLRQIYHRAGLELSCIRWFDSPVSFVLAHGGFNEGNDLDEREWDAFWENIARTTSDQVDTDLWQEANNVFADDWDTILIQQVWPILDRSFGVGLYGEHGWWSRCLSSGISKSLHAWIEERQLKRGREMDPWPSSFVFALRACDRTYDAEEGADLFGIHFLHKFYEENPRISLACMHEFTSGYRFGRQEAWLVRKPIRLQRDEEGYLHSPSGKCVEYPDGWGFYAWHGTLVPEKIILHSEQLTRADWLQEQDLPIRSVLEERMPDFLAQVGARCLEMNSQASLYVVDRGEQPQVYYVRLHESSPHGGSFRRVPSTIQHVEEAVAWVRESDDLKRQGYRPVREL